MVSHRERAQLILIGSLLVAFLVMGITIVANSVLFTENVAPSLSNKQIDNAREFDHASREETRELVHRTNLDVRNRTASQVGENTTLAVRNYSHLLAEAYARSRPVVVNLTYHNDSSALGARVVQAGDGNFSSHDPSGSGASDWEPVPGTNRTLGWFTVNANVENTSQDPYSIEVTNASGESVNVTINRSGSGTGANLTVTSNLSFGGETTITCNPSRNRVLLDLYSGDAIADACSPTASFPGIDRLDPPYDVRFEHGKRASGRYEFIVNESTGATGYGDCTAAGPALSEPCSGSVVWTANLTTSYLSGETQYVNRRNVSIYAGGG
jgi:hypothetical protein